MTMRRVFAYVVFAGCASHSAAAPDAFESSDAPNGFQPGPHEPIPQMPNNGGAILDHVQLITLSFADDPHRPTLDAFSDWVVQSQWWSTVGTQYAVLGGSHVAVDLTDNAPVEVTDADIQAFITSKLGDATLSANPESLFMIYYPPQTTVDLAIPCSGFDNMNSQAYHSSANGFRYAVIPSCSAESIANIELGAGHELIEAATDPDPLTAPAFQFVSGAWQGEVADLCDLPHEEGGYVVPTVWSNAQAAAGGDPCAPAAAGTFFDASATPSTATVAAGSTISLDIRGWSTAPMSDWQLLATAYPGYPGFTASVSLAERTLNNDSATTLEVGVPANATSGATSFVYVESELGANGAGGFRYWPVSITAK